LSDQISAGIHDIEYDTKIAIAAPTPSKVCTNKINPTIKPITWREPITRSFLVMPKKLNRDIVFVALAKGKIPAAKINNMTCPYTYSGPITDNTSFGDDKSTEITGAVKLIPILMLPVVKSSWATDEEGITIYAVLEIRPAATTLIIRAM
jgi:hypothetical protein